MRNDLALEEQRKVLDQRYKDLSETIKSSKEKQKEFNSDLGNFLVNAIHPKLELIEKDMEELKKAEDLSRLTYSKIKRLENRLMKEIAQRWSVSKKNKLK